MYEHSRMHEDDCNTCSQYITLTLPTIVCELRQHLIQNSVFIFYKMDRNHAVGKQSRFMGSLLQGLPVLLCSRWVAFWEVC